MMRKTWVIGLVGIGLAMSYGNERLHPLLDKNPLILKARISGSEDFAVSEDVPGPDLPVTVAVLPKKGNWDCSEKLWLLMDIENNGEQSVLARAEVSSVKKKGWGVNKGGINVPAGETRTLPVLIMRGMVEGRDNEMLEGLFNDMRGYPGGHQQTGWRQLDASAVNKVKLEFFTDAPRVECNVSNLRAATRFHLPSDSELKGKYTPATDAFGQNRNTDWKFKIKSESDLAKRLARLVGRAALRGHRPFPGRKERRRLVAGRSGRLAVLVDRRHRIQSGVGQNNNARYRKLESAAAKPEEKVWRRMGKGLHRIHPSSAQGLGHEHARQLELSGFLHGRRHALHRGLPLQAPVDSRTEP